MASSLNKNQAGLVEKPGSAAAGTYRNRRKSINLTAQKGSNIKNIDSETPTPSESNGGISLVNRLPLSHNLHGVWKKQTFSNTSEMATTLDSVALPDKMNRSVMMRSDDQDARLSKTTQ